jgi:hypothetical protein
MTKRDRAKTSHRRTDEELLAAHAEATESEQKAAANGFGMGRRIHRKRRLGAEREMKRRGLI